jgi:hypothetical protein
MPFGFIGSKISGSLKINFSQAPKKISKTQRDLGILSRFFTFSSPFILLP